MDWFWHEFYQYQISREQTKELRKNGDKCEAAFDSKSKSVQMSQGLRHVLMSYLHYYDGMNTSRCVVSMSPNNFYGCATTFVAQCLEMLQILSKHPNSTT